MPNRAFLLPLALMVSVVFGGCSPGSPPSAEVVLYCALDLDLAMPILERFEKQTGIRVKIVADTEATKTTALVNRLISEKTAPQCDVFWNNEPVQTERLKRAGVLASYRPTDADVFPELFRDPDHTWTGFAARARVLIINTAALAKRGIAQEPTSLDDLTSPTYRGAIGLAKPLNGTTASHFAALAAVWGHERLRQFFSALTNNAAHWESGNGVVARRVADGDYPIGLTDTDDVARLIAAGKPVKLVWPDQGDSGVGALLLPNTVSLIAGAPHPEAGKALINFLLRAEVEQALAFGPGRQIPLRNGVDRPADVPEPNRGAPRLQLVDVQAAATAFDEALAWLRNQF